MAETIKVACPGCNAIFAIPIELGGEIGECTECDTVFEIPEVSSGKKKDEVKPIIPKMSPDEVQATGTIKLSRASVGMIPDLKDAFNFGVADDRSAVQSSIPDIFATPAAQPVRTPAPKVAEPVAKAEPVKEKLRHGGLQIAKPKTSVVAPTLPKNVQNSSHAVAETKKTHNSHESQNIANIESIVITEDGLSEKDKIVSLLLCICLGMFGAHRFYVGKIVTGFFMMITFGGLGIWWWIDIIMIVTDNFKDVDGLPMQ